MRATVPMLAAVLVLAGCASRDPGRVLVVNDANAVRGCQIIGTVADNELDDLQKKAARVEAARPTLVVRPFRAPRARSG